jgi:hypothetical protein
MPSFFFLFSFIKYRRSAMAQRQREEEQLKGKLTVEESRRQVSAQKKGSSFL